jgi:hypothetical protein
MDTTCPSCGLVNVAGRSICKVCGASLSAVTPSLPSARSRPRGDWWSCLTIGVCGCLTLGLIVLLVVLYVKSQPSELDNLHRLAQMPPSSSADLATIRTTLLQRVPVGTPESGVHAFLQQNGAQVALSNASRDRQIDCRPKYMPIGADGPDIDCFIHARFRRPLMFCEHYYSVEFLMDAHRMKLKDIIVNEEELCALP